MTFRTSLFFKFGLSSSVLYALLTAWRLSCGDALVAGTDEGVCVARHLQVWSSRGEEIKQKGLVLGARARACVGGLVGGCVGVGGGGVTNTLACARAHARARCCCCCC